MSTRGEMEMLADTSRRNSRLLEPYMMRGRRNHSAPPGDLSLHHNTDFTKADDICNMEELAAADSQYRDLPPEGHSRRRQTESNVLLKVPTFYFTRKRSSLSVSDAESVKDNLDFPLKQLNDVTTTQNLENLYKDGGEVNPAFDSVSNGSTSPQKTTIVSFVINEEEGCDSSKSKKCRQNKNSNGVTVLLSVLYALVVVLTGTILPISESLRGVWLNDHVVATFLVYLFALSSAFLIYLQVEDYKRRRAVMKKASEKEGDRPEPTQSAGDKEEKSPSVLVYRRRSRGAAGSDEEFGTPTQRSIQSTDASEDVRSVSEDSSSDLNEEIMETISFQTQTASLSHEVASIYLRLGVLLFGIGNFVLVSLELEYYFRQNINHSNCPEAPQIYPIIFQMIFLTVQTFFILKHTQVQIKKRQGLARFGLMHVLATNMCTWVRILVKEVTEGVSNHNHYDTTPAASNSSSCTSGGSLLTQAAPFLFPCVLEYSLIAVAVMAGMFQGLYIRVSQDVIEMIRKAVRKRSTEHTTPAPSHEAGHGEHGGMFDKSHRGIYMGMLVLTGAIISIILFFYYLNSLNRKFSAISIFHITDISIHAVLLFAAIYILIRFFKLHFTLSRNNTIDDRLLILSLAGLFLFEGFIMVSSIGYLVYVSDIPQNEYTLTWLALGASGLNIIQAVVQTVFVIDGLQRCSVRAEDRRKKPGRGFVTFLLISNVALWIFKTFQVKEVGLETQVLYFGKTPWAIILNINLPLMLFYRFHSSVCMADIWSSAYEDEHNDMGYQVLH